MSQAKREVTSKVLGAISLGLGVLGVLAVLCFWFPAELTTPELRAVYPVPVLRVLLQGVIAGAFVAGIAAIALTSSGRFALIGAVLALVATALGGASVHVAEPVARSPHVGLDWFLLDLVLSSVIYVPIERLFPRVGRPVLRAGISTDLTYFFVNHLLVHVLLFLALFPATTLLGWARHPSIAALVASQPIALQVAEIVVAADVFQYVIHRLFHAVPCLWRVHAVHHSSEHLDWLAGSRLHLVDIVVVRAFTFTPLFVLGFDDRAIRVYAVLVALAGVLLHANVRFRFGLLEKIIVTPAYHAVHHAQDACAVDKNFAFHLPFLDRLFGTQYLPPAAPTQFGIEGPPVPSGYVRQFVHPFTRQTPDSPSLR